MFGTNFVHKTIDLTIFKYYTFNLKILCGNLSVHSIKIADYRIVQ